MPSLTFSLAVELEDGLKYSVTADQRDIVRWERHPKGGPLSASHTCQRFLAWSASQRTGLTSATWDAWDKTCVEAVEEAGAPDDAEDPGQPAPSPTRTSRSRSRRASA